MSTTQAKWHFQDPFGSTSIKDPATLMGDSSRKEDLSARRPGDRVTRLGRNLNSGVVDGDSNKRKVAESQHQ